MNYKCSIAARLKQHRTTINSTNNTEQDKMWTLSLSISIIGVDLPQTSSFLSFPSLVLFYLPSFPLFPFPRTLTGHLGSAVSYPRRGWDEDQPTMVSSRDRKNQNPTSCQKFIISSQSLWGSKDHHDRNFIKVWTWGHSMNQCLSFQWLFSNWTDVSLSTHWRYVSLVVALRRPALSASASS